MPTYDKDDSFPLSHEQDIPPQPRKPVNIKRVVYWIVVTLATISLVFSLAIAAFDLMASRQSQFRHVFYGEALPKTAPEEKVKVIKVPTVLDIPKVQIPEGLTKDTEINYILEELGVDGKVTVQTNRVLVVKAEYGIISAIIWYIGFIVCFILALFFIINVGYAMYRNR